MKGNEGFGERKEREKKKEKEKKKKNFGVSGFWFFPKPEFIPFRIIEKRFRFCVF